MSDPHFLNVSLLVHADGSHGSTTFTDSSLSPKTLTRVGSSPPTISTTQSKFGGASARTILGALEASANAAYAFGSSDDYTIEFHFRRTAGNGSTGLMASLSGTANRWAFYWRFTDRAAVAHATAGVFLNGTTPLALNTWYHYALTKQGTTFRLFINGNLEASATSSALTDAAPMLHFGDNTLNGEYFEGYIDEMRVTKGVARYTASFTAPVAAYPNFGDVVGAGAVTLDITAEAYGAHGVAGAGAVTLDITADAAGEYLLPFFEGVGAATLDFTVEAYGAHGVAGAGAVTLDFTAEAVGAHGVSGVGAVTLDFTAEAYGVHERYEVRGEVRVGGVLVNRQVRVYLRDTGEMVGEAATVAGRFQIHCGLTPEEHYIVPVHLEGDAEDWLPPTANRVVSVLALDA